MKNRYMRPLRGAARSSMLLWVLSVMWVMAITDALYAQRHVLTVQYDNMHTGWNPNEVILNINNVNRDTFGKKWTAQLDGMIYGAPLYVSGVNIRGQMRNAVYVATESNLIYALEAETGAQLWTSPYFLGAPGDEINIKCGGSLGPKIGIASTPVIDLETKTLYAVGLTCQGAPCVEGSAQIFKMAAVDITNGEPRPGWPVTINPPADVLINTQVTSNRGALLLANRTVYVPFGGYAGDCGPYHGWVVGVSKDNPTAPQVYYRTPGDNIHTGGGIWASGGIAADDQGFIYPATGNSFNAPGLDYSNAVLRLNPDLSFSEDPANFFMPSNWKELNASDYDLGSSAPMLLPSQKGSNTPNLIFVAGKLGVGHLINRDDLGGVAKGDGIHGEGVFSTEVFGGVFSTAVYYEDPIAGPTIFLAGIGDQPDCDIYTGVAALALDLDEDRNSSYHTAWCTRSMIQAVSPVVTSAPGQTGILWVVDREAGVLYAYNAATGDELYNSEEVPGDRLGDTRNFLHFTAVDGRVFIGNSSNRVVAYGLR